jgi:four helix bundle protein
MQDHRKLRVYPESLELCADVFRITPLLPFDQRFGLSSQIGRASMSVALNIAEGAGRDTSNDFAHFLDMAVGSANEVECCLDIAVKLNFLGLDQTDGVRRRVGKVRSMLCALIKTVRGRRGN